MRLSIFFNLYIQIYRPISILFRISGEANDNPKPRIVAKFTVLELIDPYVGGINLRGTHFYVRKEFRKFGIFKQIFSFICDLAENNPDIKAITWYAIDYNKLARSIYLRYGMKERDIPLYCYDKQD